MRPGTFAALTHNPQVFVHNDSGWDPVRGRVDSDTGLVYLECRDPTSQDSVSWMVVAERRDAAWLAHSDVDASGVFWPEQPKSADLPNMTPIPQ